MGMYDILRLPNTPADEEQVKLWWNDMQIIWPGGKVPPRGNLTSYGVVLPSGGIAVIRDCVLVGWTPWPMDDNPLFDKWGGNWEGNTQNKGMLDSPYFYNSKEYEEWRKR